MNEYNDLDTYTGDAIHDMWGDYDYNEKTGELPYIEEEIDLDNFN